MSLHAFVLMSNHYHMMVTANENHPLGEVMCELQKSVSRRINKKSERINHVFGGPYKASLIRRDDHYLDVFKYIHRNPIEAGVVQRVEMYPYSTLTSNQFLVLKANEAIVVPKDVKLWLNTEEEGEKVERIFRGLRKTEFRMSALRT